MQSEKGRSAGEPKETFSRAGIHPYNLRHRCVALTGTHWRCNFGPPLFATEPTYDLMGGGVAIHLLALPSIIIWSCCEHSCGYLSQFSLRLPPALRRKLRALPHLRPPPTWLRSRFIGGLSRSLLRRALTFGSGDFLPGRGCHRPGSSRLHRTIKGSCGSVRSLA